MISIIDKPQSTLKIKSLCWESSLLGIIFAGNHLRCLMRSPGILFQILGLFGATGALAAEVDVNDLREARVSPPSIAILPSPLTM
jgi:hypothetical protein